MVDGLILVAGVIRKKSGSWSVLDDKGHTPVNIAGVRDAGSHLVIEFGFTADEVVSMTTTPDESYVVQGYSFGASVGYSEARVYIHQEGQAVGAHVSPRDMPEGNSNIWVLGYLKGVKE